MIFQQSYFLWPDQWPKTCAQQPLLEAARLLRLQQFQAAESRLLLLCQQPSAQQSALALLVLLRLRYVQLMECQELLARLDRLAPAHPVVSFLRAQYWLQTAAIPELLAQPAQFWQPVEAFWPLLLAQAALCIHLNKLKRAEQLLHSIPLPWRDCLEAIRLRCRLLERQQRHRDALALLLPAAARFPQHWPTQVHLVDLTIKARSQEHALPCMRQARTLHGDAPELLPHIVNIDLLRNRIADARHAALSERVWHSVRPVASEASTNVHNCYDRLGYGEWLSFEPKALLTNNLVLSLEMQENRCMQAASQELSETQSVITDVLAHYRSHPDFARVAVPLQHQAPRSAALPDKRLTVAWITADLAYHPVSRFLLGFFTAAAGLRHRHVVVDTCDHLAESNRNLFETLPALEVVNYGSGEWPDKLRRIRELRPDVSIDLSGWTGGHFMRGFLARMAPVQMSYLGYFASTGVPQMDIWLGDGQLFPEPMHEWHVESIHRLSRCFIAWQPPEVLPEAGVEVAEARAAGGIRFGSFNHNRKLSDRTLRVWGELLASLPDASLVLKASRRDDAATQTLLCRRMQRQGLDPARVIWLPRAEGPVDHLRQYGLIDVALDCFPNGGCTTTCEALWMGTPVLTLTGHSYVSRMSTAVLHGAAMAEWCAPSLQHYLGLARAQADRLSWLRQNREHWRHQLTANPLGDAAGLMAHLERAFSTLAAAVR